MKRYINYLKYVIKHKWYVFYAGIRYLPFSFKLLYRLIVHDISKLYPSEFIAYAKTFYKSDGSSQYVESEQFSLAWCYHQYRNSHHWQRWVLRYDRGDIESIQIPTIYVEEMIADWIGAGKAITGKWDNVFAWYEKAEAMKKHLHPVTKHQIEFYLDDILFDMNED